MKREGVKYLIGLKLINAGYRNFEDFARKVGISPSYLSIIINCVEQPAEWQQKIADLLGCMPREIFGPCTNPSLIKKGRKAC